MVESNSMPSIDQLTPTLVQNGSSFLPISTDLSNTTLVQYFIGLISYKYGLRVGRKEFIAMMRLVPLVMIDLILLVMWLSMFLKDQNLYFPIILIAFLIAFFSSVFITFRLIKWRLCDLNTEISSTWLFWSIVDLTLLDGTVWSNKFGPDPRSFVDQFTATDYVVFNFSLFIRMLVTIVIGFFVFYWGFMFMV